MDDNSRQPRILLVTPEISLVPDRSGKISAYSSIKSGGFAGFLSRLAGDLYARGADIHFVQPDYRSIFTAILRNKADMKACRLPAGRVHLAHDRAFYYVGDPGSNTVQENMKIALAFQREVIHGILPRVKPDLIHCHDWMCGLIPAVAGKSGTPCIFSLQSCATVKCVLSVAEDVGIDAALFWQLLYFDRFPGNYEETRETNAIDFLLSGVLAADHVNIANPALLAKIAESFIRSSDAPLVRLLSEKLAVDCNTTTDAGSNGMQYVDLYERLLRRPVLKIDVKKSKLRGEFPRHLNRLDLSEKIQIGDIQYAHI